MSKTVYDASGILRVALYIRVSTEEQANHGISLIAQEDSLAKYAQSHGYKIIGIYRDEGNSARKPIMKRPVMLQLLEDVKAGKIDRILFTKLDRWFRNVREYHNVQDILESHNVTWQATLEDYDTMSANGRLRVNIMLSVNESEADRDSERIKFVFESKRQRREWCFTGAHWPYGYMPQEIDGVKRCVKDPDKEPIMQDFWDYVVKYNSVRKAGMYCCEKYGITRHYRSWMVTARNELYTGTFHGVDNYCPAYISREDWERIILGHQIIKKTQKPDRVYLFTGLIRCPDCGNTLKGTFKTYPNDRTKEFNGYRCNNSRLRICSFPHQLSERKIEKQLKEKIQAKIEEYIQSVEVSRQEQQAKSKVHDIVALNEQLRRLNTIFLSGNMDDDEYISATARIKQEIEKAKKQESETKPANLDGLREFLQSDFLTIYDTLDKEDRRRIWRSILEEIYIDKTSIIGVKFRT